jgi:hypothetical protein
MKPQNVSLRLAASFFGERINVFAAFYERRTVQIFFVALRQDYLFFEPSNEWQFVVMKILLLTASNNYCTY